MSLRKVDPNNWLTYDSAYEKEHLDKLKYMNGEMHDEVVQVLPNADDSCEELLQIIVEYITRRYPDMFKLDGDDIVIVPMKERYRVRAPYDRHPMEVAGLLVMDDLYVLHLGELDRYYLRACFLACPSGWRLKDRIGWPLHQMHGPVPTWKEKLQKSMEKFFLHIKVDGAIQRNNVFIQPCPGIFHQEPMDQNPPSKTVEDIEIRTELQSLRRLPRTGAVVFTVRTYMNPLTDLGKEPMALNRLWDAVRNYPDKTAAYKVRHLWTDIFEKYCCSILGRGNPDQGLLEEQD
ncbi:hypothetical protein A1O3_04628 [Capronia epimyces CBS 606.96]|uniref:Uncharacterized protein n=1 Tax=Capronia epimyces CBS 606.96 TaxID=1182542 RepID=W9Y426_9EURO|nr:uncharacterized protein A1O3_04628 [Capronia epimyces CBS 606.96]EXJ83961.1 hypothetical protein A1O3_04628 [Capronia epimyces CBS 606.96]